MVTNQTVPNSLPSSSVQPSSQYQILELVGQGQYGRVYCGVHRQTGRLFALKELDSKRFPSKKFLREFRFLASLQQRNIVSCHAIEYNENGRYLVMDYCEGGTLRPHLELGQLTLGTGLKLICDILRGLHYVHKRGLVHCDLKPENVLLHLGAGGWMAKLSDFGVARSPGEVISGSMGDTGSPAYMSPERFYGEYSFASDLYAVGIMLYELVLGERPFSGAPAELMSAHINQGVEVPKEVPYLLRCAISRALQKLPAKRYGSAKEMYNAVQLALQVEGMDKHLKPVTMAFAKLPLKIIAQESFPEKITALGVEGKQIYFGSKKQVICKRYSGGILTSDVLQQWQVQLSNQIKEFSLRPPKADNAQNILDGCFVVTEGFSLYRLPYKAMSLWQASQNALFSFPVGAMRSAIAPTGNWVALALGDGWSEIAHYDSANFQILELPNLRSIKAPFSCPFPSGLVLLDDQHGLVAFPQIDSETKVETTLMRLFNHHGDFLTYFKLPSAISHLTLGKEPYQVFALESKTQQGLIINLKPFQVKRFPLSFEPHWVVAQKWGYILVNSQAQISLIDNEGNILGNYTLPIEGEIGIVAACEESALLLATFHQTKGILYKFDLTGLESKTN